jgi:hypothetical protein
MRLLWLNWTDTGKRFSSCFLRFRLLAERIPREMPLMLQMILMRMVSMTRRRKKSSLQMRRKVMEMIPTRMTRRKMMMRKTKKMIEINNK